MVFPQMHNRRHPGSYHGVVAMMWALPLYCMRMLAAASMLSEDSLIIRV
jgi:hypothetical protein